MISSSVAEMPRISDKKIREREERKINQILVFSVKTVCPLSGLLLRNLPQLGFVLGDALCV